MTVLGLLLLATAGLLALADIGGLSDSMPVQVPPRRVARYPLAAGAVLLLVGLVGSLFP